MSRVVGAVAVLVAALALAAVADASTGGWSTVNWSVLGVLAVAGAVFIGVRARRGP